MRCSPNIPDIKVVAEANGMWSQAVARTELSKIVATHPWDTIDGLWMQAGCYTAFSMQSEAGIADDKLKPCAGEGSNGHRIQMLPACEGRRRHRHLPADGRAEHLGSSQVYPGAMPSRWRSTSSRARTRRRRSAFAGPGDQRHREDAATPASWAEMKAGCNAFSPALVPNPGWFASVYHADLPEVGIQAALVGQPEN